MVMMLAQVSVSVIEKHVGNHLFLFLLPTSFPLILGGRQMKIFPASD